MKQFAKLKWIARSGWSNVHQYYRGRSIRMRGQLLLAIFLGAIVAACAPPDTPNMPVSLAPPYSDLPDPWPERTLEPGMPVKLDQRQLEAVVDGVLKWMKDPASVSFTGINGVKNRRGIVTVCGDVSGRNSAGVLVSKSPFVGALMGRPDAPTFVVVDIGAYGKQRTVVEGLCYQSGIYRDADAKGS
jgi:hypothetical protein